MELGRILKTIATLFAKNDVDAGYVLNHSKRSSPEGSPADAPSHGREIRGALWSEPDDTEQPVAQQEKDQGAQFDEKLALLLQSRRNLLAGSLELIGLEEIRGALGDKWELLAKRVISLAESELRRSLDPSDSFRRHGDASFLIHFDGLDKPAAEEKTRRTAARIKAALIEQIPDVAEAIAIRPFVADVSTSGLGQVGTSLSDALFSRLVRMRMDAMDELRQRRHSLRRDVSVLFSPVWHKQKEITILNRCLVDLSYYRTLSAQLHELSDPDEIEDLTAEVDYLVLTKSIEALHNQRQTGRPAVLLLPIDFATIHNPKSAKEYARLLEVLPGAYRKQIVLEVRNIDIEVGVDEIYESIAQIADLVRAWVVELSTDDSRITDLLAKGVWAISTTLSAEEVGMDRLLVAQLQRFTELCGNGAHTLASGANTIGLAQAAYHAGFTLIEGTAIHLPTRELRQGVRLRILSLPYRSMDH